MINVMKLTQCYNIVIKEISSEETEYQKEKGVSTSFLIEAVSVTDVETKITEYYKDLAVNYKIMSVKINPFSIIIQ